ncbi:MAG: hypothetical protein M1828_006725 [Chrysothrix sp. TS-e1954]|nr:MAG: hypothetical protein M1828_006725 [Chrysothrix sp. TS-e1954]
MGLSQLRLEIYELDVDALADVINEADLDYYVTYGYLPREVERSLTSSTRATLDANLNHATTSSAPVKPNASSSHDIMATTVAAPTANGAPKAPPAPAQHDASANAKRGKGKKAADPVNTKTQIDDMIQHLEGKKAGEREQEQEIDREVKRATRDLTNLLSNIQGPLARVDTVQKKYTELLTDMKRTERDHIKAKKRADQLQKEKDSSRSELTKVNVVKDKLEKLCRELQKDNKKLQEDAKRLEETESQMREQLHDRLESMVDDVQEVIAQKESPETLPANVEADEQFRQKFKSFCDQYELRETQFHSLLRTKDLELQSQTTRYESSRKASEQEAQKSRQLTTQVSTFSQTETELRGQLNIYVEKFKQVEDTLNNSNDLFLTFRREMEEMSKKTKRLEKENGNLTRKHELVNSNIVQMAEDRTKTQKDIDALRKRNDNLEKLCRGMQAQGRAVSGANANFVKGSDGDAGVLGEEGTEESDYEEEEYEDDEDEGSEVDGFDEIHDAEDVILHGHSINSGQQRLRQGNTQADDQAAAGTQQQQASGLQGQRPLPDFARPELANARAPQRQQQTMNGQTTGKQVNGVKH